MKSSPAEIERILAELEGTPGRLTDLTSGMRDDVLHNAPDNKSWSAAEILAHLRACADNWTYSIYAALAENTPELTDINERKWARVTGYARLPFERSLQAFALQREELLYVLKTLMAEGWERPVIISGRRHTVFSQARRLAKHEAKHCIQMESVMQ
jgi:hypothetical protein